MRWRVSAALLAFALLGAVPRVAHAQTPTEREAARSLMDEGDRRRDAADLKGALVAYTKADDIMHVPSTTIEVARTQAALGQLLAAKETLARLKAMPSKPGEPTPFAAARKEGEALATDVAARTPTLQVNVSSPPKAGAADNSSGASPQILVDGEALPPGPSTPHKVNPGRHAVVVRLDGVDRSRDVLVLERENKVVTIDTAGLVEPPKPTSEDHPGPVRSTSTAGDPTAKALVFGGFGLAVVGIGVGAVTGLLSVSKTNDLKPNCPNNICPQGSDGDIDSANTLGNISTIAFIAGGAGAVAGIVGLVLALRSTDHPRATGRPTWHPVLGASYAGVGGSF